MSELHPYSYGDPTDIHHRKLVVTRMGGGISVGTQRHDEDGTFWYNEGHSYAPTDPAELHKLTEAIHGRKVAAIVYEDELQNPVRDSWITKGQVAETYWCEARLNIAIARHIEARDAAAKEQEAEREREVEALREELLTHSAHSPTASAQFTRMAARAYELGARVDGAQSEVTE